MSEEPRARRPGEVDYGELPELTRALRALGSPRRSAGAMQMRFFAPLLDARRAVAGGDAEAALRAFDAAGLTRALDQVLESMVRGWPDDRASVRRAVRAELQERVREYKRALEVLDDRAADVLAEPQSGRLHAWRNWTVQLAAVFDAADRAWLAVRAVVDALPAQP